MHTHHLYKSTIRWVIGKDYRNWTDIVFIYSPRRLMHCLQSCTVHYQAKYTAFSLHRHIWTEQRSENMAVIQLGRTTAATDWFQPDLIPSLPVFLGCSLTMQEHCQWWKPNFHYTAVQKYMVIQWLLWYARSTVMDDLVTGPHSQTINPPPTLVQQYN